MKILVLACLMSALVATGLGAQGSARRSMAGLAGQGVADSQAVRAGNLVYVGEQLPVDDTGRVVEGGIAAQIDQVFRNLRRVLEQAGSSLANLIGVNVVYQSFNEYSAVDQAFRQHIPSREALPSRDANFARLLVPGALVAMSATAVPNGVSRQLVPLSPDWAKETVAFNYSVIGDDTLMFATCGRVLESFTMFVGPFPDQARNIMDIAAAFLRNAGMSLDDVVSTQVVLDDMALLPAFDEVYRKYWKTAPPARAVHEGSCGFRRENAGMAKVAFVAVRGASSRKQPIVSPGVEGLDGVDPRFSPALKVGNRLFVSGVTGANATNQTDLEGQTSETLTRIGGLLKAAGFDYSDVVFSEVFVTIAGPPLPDTGPRVFETRAADAEKLRLIDEAYRPFFVTDPPARSAMSAGRLPDPEALVQIMVKAVR